ncbi:hypothetical protein ACFE04_015102 [Oxalis oulophora]
MSYSSTILNHHHLLISSNFKTLISKHPNNNKNLPFTKLSLLKSNNRLSLLVKCSKNPEEENLSLKDALSGMVDERVDVLLNREENKGLLDGLEKASLRVEMAKRQLSKIEEQEFEAQQRRDYIQQLETRASEIAECQREILEASALVEEAELSLSRNTNEPKNEERLESVKAALISALIGALIGLPISLTQVSTYFELILPVSINFISCALFGVTFRYVIRRDIDNIQLKTGASGAFAFVKGLATLGGGPPLELNLGSLSSHAFDGALLVSENLLVFVFAGVGLDFCLKTGILSPFPIKASPEADVK